MSKDVWNSDVLVQFRSSLEDWRDERLMCKQDIATCAMFFLYLVNLAEAEGWEYLGHSWRERTSLGCLVVKARMEETQYVAFTSARTTISGMRIFLRKMREGRVEWVEDRFA